MDDRGNPYSPPDSPAAEPVPSQPKAPIRLPASDVATIVVCCLALPPILYVGSFVCLVIDSEYGWGIVGALDNETTEALFVFYLPLIWLYIVLTGTE